MNDDEIRALVRVAIQRHLGAPVTGGSPDDGRGGSSAFAHSASTFALSASADKSADTSAATSVDRLDPPAVAVSMSFGRYALPRAADDSMCLIEPAVRCNHCGYCECHGH